MRKIIIMGIILLLTSTGCAKEPESQEDSPKIEAKHAVEVFGTIRVLDEKSVMIDFPAGIEMVHVRDGQRVKEGEPLVTLNINEFRTEIVRKEKELNIACLELDKNNDDTELKKLMNNLKYEEEMYKKAEALSEAGAIPQYQLEGNDNSVEGKRKSVEELKLSLSSLENERDNNLKIQNEKISALEYELKALRDKLNKSYLRDNVITADIQNGLVYDIGYLPGEVVDNEKKVFSLINLDSIFVQVDVAEEFIKDVKLNAPATIVPVADKSKQYQGRVIRISDKAMQKNGETIIPVEIAVENKDSFLLPEFNVDVSIDME